MNKKIMVDYNIKIKNVSEFIFEKYNLSKFIKCSNIEEKKLLKNIYEQKLYNLILDISNQLKFNVLNQFSKDDIMFVVDFEIDKIMEDIITMIVKEIYI